MKRKNLSNGFSLVELMVSLTIFTTVILAATIIYKTQTTGQTSARMTQSALNYIEAESTRLICMARLPKRDSAGNLLYFSATGSTVSTGGSLQTYGYDQLLTTSFLGGVNGEVVTYPDALADQLPQDMNLERITMRRTFKVTVHNLGGVDEYKEVEMTLSPASADGKSFPPIVKTIQIKKPHPQALDTRSAQGTAALTGRVVNKTTGQPIVPSTSVVVTLIPSDGTASRFTGVDENGNFYFAPPINANTSYTVKFESTLYWPVTVPVLLNPGSNVLLFNGQSTIGMPPRLWTNANFRVVHSVTQNPVVGAQVTVYHNNPGAPNSRPSSYLNLVTNASGELTYSIEIPQPEVTSYNLYYVNSISMNDFITINTPADKVLTLQKDIPTSRTYELVPVFKGNIRVTVNDSDGYPTNKAYVDAFLASNYTTLVAQGQTDSNGTFTLENIPTNTSALPNQLTRRIYVRVRAAGHQQYLTYVDMPADTTTELHANMTAHSLYWDNNTNAVNLKKGLAQGVQSKLWYNGHQGPGVNDANAGPNPTAFLSQTLSGGGAPANFTWSNYDTNLLLVTATANNDKKSVLCLETGFTQATVNATYNFIFGGRSYSLNASRVYDITCSSSLVPLTVTISPNTTRVNPGSITVFTANPNQTPYDLIYTWSVTGAGSATIEPINSAGTVVANGTTGASRVRITASSTINTHFTLTVQVQSTSLGQSASRNLDVDVNYVPLALSMLPVTAVNMQPGFTQLVQALPSGGSGNYSYAWTMLDTVTGNADTTTGSLSSVTNAQTTFTALQVNSVNVNVRVTDTASNQYLEGTVIINVQPPGGVTQ